MQRHRERLEQASTFSERLDSAATPSTEFQDILRHSFANLGGMLPKRFRSSLCTTLLRNSGGVGLDAMSCPCLEGSGLQAITIRSF